MVAFVPAAGAVTAAAVLAVFVWTGHGQRDSHAAGESGNAASAFEDIDLLADGEAPDFLSETNDVEFYEWAAGEIDRDDRRTMNPPARPLEFLGGIDEVNEDSPRGDFFDFLADNDVDPAAEKPEAPGKEGKRD